MGINTFLGLLFVFSVISSLITEGVKNLIDDKENVSYNIAALVVSIIIGGGGTILFFFFKGVSFTMGNIIYAILMGLATGLCSMVGYDKVKQTVEQLISGITVDESNTETETLPEDITTEE